MNSKNPKKMAGGGPDLSAVRARLRGLLPVILSALLIAANLGVGLVMVLPAWQQYADLDQSFSAQQALLATAQAGDGQAVTLLQTQVAAAHSRLAGSSTILLSETEADDLLQPLYSYASSIGVEITALQLQPGQDTPDTAQPYSVRQFKLRIAGSAPQLVAFLALFQEASIPAVKLDHLTLSSDEAGHTLAMDLLVYTSPFAGGTVLAGLPLATLPQPMPTPQPTATRLPPTPTITPPPPTPTPSAIPPTATPTLSGPVFGLGTYDDGHSALRYTAGFWEALDSLQGYGGAYHYSADLDAEVQFNFVGTSVAIQYVAFTNFGIFEVYVDGELWDTVDSYAEVGTFGQVLTITGLPRAAHTLSIRNSGERNPASTGNVIAIDVIHVLAS